MHNIFGIEDKFCLKWKNKLSNYPDFHLINCNLWHYSLKLNNFIYNFITECSQQRYFICIRSYYYILQNRNISLSLSLSSKEPNPNKVSSYRIKPPFPCFRHNRNSERMNFLVPDTVVRPELSLHVRRRRGVLLVAELQSEHRPLRRPLVPPIDHDRK